MVNPSVSSPSRTGGDARPATEPVLRVRAVSKTYAARGVRALDPVDFDLYHGQFASIIGPSGCGKSTLLKIMAGLLRATTGDVTLRGTPVVGPRRDIGIMFQQATLLPWRTALKNVLLPIEIRDGASAAKARVPDAMALLEMVGLTGFEKVYPHELSGGMAQRAAICRMFITEPAVLLLDEPFGALDELTREYMNVELQRICHAREATAFMVTHSIPEAVFLGDVVVVMTARPGVIREVVPVDLPRPRSLDMMTEPRFGEIVRHVRSLLDVETQL
jgi:NitT/TauT family transport system ATP-binding protein